MGVVPEVGTVASGINMLPCSIRHHSFLLLSVIAVLPVDFSAGEVPKNSLSSLSTASIPAVLSLEPGKGAGSDRASAHSFHKCTTFTSCKK